MDKVKQALIDAANITSSELVKAAAAIPQGILNQPNYPFANEKEIASARSNYNKLAALQQTILNAITQVP